MPVIKKGQKLDCLNGNTEELSNQIIKDLGIVKETYNDPARANPNLIDTKHIQEVYQEQEAQLQQQKRQRAAEYQHLIDECRKISLERLVTCKAGQEIFNDLCLRIDINQKYVECLPQWKDVAQVLKMDELKTNWVQVCVRPADGLTRAILEIYMKDGGTLGDVLEALNKLQCLEILEKVKDKIWYFLQKNPIDKMDEGDDGLKSKFFSVLTVLNKVFGQEDPCYILQSHANGLYQPKLQTEALTTHHLQISGPGTGVTNADPNPLMKSNSVTSLIELKDKLDVGKVDVGKEASSEDVCRILLLFADDGIDFAEEICTKFHGFEFKGRRVEFFRLNEASLWYEILINPEACCTKWVHEADYAMPILTTKYLQEVNSGKSDDLEQLKPTSPMLNRFIYVLLRSRVTAMGSLNKIVRPVLPRNFLNLAGNSAITVDPLFRSAWVELSDDKLRKRLCSLLNHKKV